MAERIKTAGISSRNNRKIRIFLFFLFLTSVIWLLVALSKVYTSTTKIKVTYTNLPSSKLLLKKPAEEIEGLINATGFNLIKYKVKPPKISLSLQESKKNGARYFLLPNNQLESLNNKLLGNSKLVKFLTDTIFVELGNNITKKVPVNLKLKINFKLGYNFIEELKVIPDSITISGSKRILDSIFEITTNTLILNEVYENVKEKLLLKAPKYKNVQISDISVVVTGEVDKFTEGKFLIPVTIINIPKDLKIVTFPKEVEVVFQAGLTNFSKITKSNFVVVFDYLQYQNDTLVRYLSPIVEQKSDMISSLKINPSQIEFLIQK